jgi:hypothetical protein
MPKVQKIDAWFGFRSGTAVDVIRSSLSARRPRPTRRERGSGPELRQWRLEGAVAPAANRPQPGRSGDRRPDVRTDQSRARLARSRRTVRPSRGQRLPSSRGSEEGDGRTMAPGMACSRLRMGMGLLIGTSGVDSGHAGHDRRQAIMVHVSERIDTDGQKHQHGGHAQNDGSRPTLPADQSVLRHTSTCLSRP